MKSKSYSLLRTLKSYLNYCRPAMYQFYQIMICLLKFDFFCFIGVTSQVGQIWQYARQVIHHIRRHAAPHRRFANELGRVRTHHRCDPRSALPASRMWCSSSARDQVVGPPSSRTNCSGLIQLQADVNIPRVDARS